MGFLNEKINKLKNLKEHINFKKNCCNELFKNNVNKDLLDEDVYYSARAFASLLNTLVNKKVEYANYILNSQIELFLYMESYDDKYLSNIPNLLDKETYLEFYFIMELYADIKKIIAFLEVFFENIDEIQIDKYEDLFYDKSENAFSDNLKKQIDEIFSNLPNLYEDMEGDDE